MCLLQFELLALVLLKKGLSEMDSLEEIFLVFEMVFRIYTLVAQRELVELLQEFPENFSVQTVLIGLCQRDITVCFYI